MNPVVTLAFAVRGVFRWSDVPAYWLVQLAGAAGAAGVLWMIFGNVAHLGAPHVRVASSKAFVIELLLTWIRVTVI